MTASPVPVPTRSPARTIVESIADPELPMLTLVDLGIVRGVEQAGDSVVVTITPTYSGCPAIAAIRGDIARRLGDAGYRTVTIRTVLAPAWTSDWITAAGRRKLAESGCSPPGLVGQPSNGGPVPLTLFAKRGAVTCPLCASSHAEVISEFGATLCRALYRCRDCREPFDHVKEI